jgi:choline dehydrogenase
MKLPACKLALLGLATLQGSTVLAQDYDYIVIGAGSAGSIVAAELAKFASADVLLVEAGGDNFDPAIDNLQSYFNVAFNSFNYGFMQWGYSTTPQRMTAAAAGTQNMVISLPRGKALGGTHSINAAAYVQANKEDFDNIADELNDPDWNWQRTASLRANLERSLGIVELGRDQVGAEDFIATAREVLSFPFNEDPTDGHQYGISGAYWTARETTSGGRRRSSFDTFVKPLIGKPLDSAYRGSVDVVTFHQVEKLIFDPEDITRVLGVSCTNLRANIPTEFYASREVIVSAGAYNSPQILMHSGIGQKRELEALGIESKLHLPGVGRNLRDHYAVATFWNLVGLEQTAPFLFQSPSLNMFGPEWEGQTSFQMELSGNFGSCVPLRQDSQGTVRLQSNSTADPPLIDPNILSTQNDIDRLVECLRDYLLPFFKGLIAKGLLSPGNINPDASDEELYDFVVANVGTNHHPVGTCRVGTDSHAVVDKDFKVRGMSNLRVVDASVFPKVPSGNINAPTMTAAMIAAKKILDEDSSRRGLRV